MLDLVMLGLVAAAAIVSVKVVGVILTVAVLVTPAAAARQWSARLPRIMLLSAAFVCLAGIVGLYGAYYVRVAPAAIVVVTLAMLFALSLAIGRRVRSSIARSESTPRR